MWNELKQTAAAFAILISVCAPLAAQSEKQLEQNKRLVLEFWREVLDAHHVELASKYLLQAVSSTIRTSRPDGMDL
jgi:hypothetical protein